MAVSKAELSELQKAFERSKGKSKSALSLAAAKCLNNKAGLSWSSNAHTALPVETSATGKHADAFKGSIDNTDIAKMLKLTVR